MKKPSQHRGSKKKKGSVNNDNASSHPKSKKRKFYKKKSSNKDETEGFGSRGSNNNRKFSGNHSSRNSKRKSKLIEVLKRDLKKSETEENLIPIDRSFQKIALEKIDQKINLLISAPVGSGKTYLVYEVVKKRKVALAVPTKALANNVYAAAKSNDIKCMLTTGDFEIVDDEYQLIIGTAEKISQLDDDQIPDIIFIDEASWMFDPDRGISTYMDMIESHPHLQFVLMSGTIDAESTITLFERLTKRKMELIEVKGSAIHHFYNPYVPRNYEEWQEVPKPCIVFCDNKIQATKLTESLKNNGFRCAIHHSSLDLLTKIKNEINLQNSQIEFLIGTSGLAYGINTPTRSVVVYNPGLASVQTVSQILGRAGRPGYWSRGFAFGVTQKQLSKVDKKKMLRLGLRDRCLPLEEFRLQREKWVEMLRELEEVENHCLNGRIDAQFWKYLENDVPVEIQERLFKNILASKKISATDYLLGKSYANDSTTLHWLEKISDNPELPSIDDLEYAAIMFEKRWKVQKAMSYLREYHDKKE